jgi:hypothetical protein
LTIYGANGRWDDEACSELEQFVCEDACPSSDKVTPGVCGCETPDDDSDDDGTEDCIDECPDNSDPECIAQVPTSPDPRAIASKAL